MKPAIEIRNLGKDYRLSTSSRYTALRDVLADTVKNIFSNRERNETFNALNDINLTIQPGERVGIIGSNGAGKSTLLKIISRITPPTTGEVIVRGRVGSLLEVGTGFHPELTGRENIYLNGSILGLKRTEINKQLNAIIDFSGVEKFIDTPLKHFSSGMQLRLAFAVAAHLEPEILLIDEVLAVGDLEFQRKCIGKMEEVSSKNGRTILFVSHNMGLVKKICDKVVYMKKGTTVQFAESNRVINQYLTDISVQQENPSSKGTNTIQLNKIVAKQEDNGSGDVFLGYPLQIEIAITASQPVTKAELALNFKTDTGDLISHITTLDKGLSITIKEGKNEINILLPAINFTPGEYFVDLFVLDNNDIIDSWYDCIRITVLNSDKAARPGGFPSHVKTFSESIWTVNGTRR